MFQLWLAVWVALACAPRARGEAVPVARVIQLAVSHSAAMDMAAADQARLRATYLEARNTYIPQFMVGSGLAGSYGFPLSIEGAAPSIVNLNAQSFLLNPAQREFVRAAKTEWQASSASTEDRRNQVILEAAAAYIELDKTLAQITLMRQQEEAAARQEHVVSQRLQAGIDSAADLTRARLATARVRMRAAQVQGRADVLRTRLAQLTGLPAEGLSTQPESIPQMPAADLPGDPVSRALEVSPAVRLAEQQALARAQRAKGEHRALLPAVDLVGQYGLFAKYNNYDQYFLKFQRHNATFGVSIRFPFFNQAQKARAEAADADAQRARKEVQGVKERVSSQALELQHAVEQQAAARDVAQLEYDLARTDKEAVEVKVQAGTATLAQREAARLTEGERYGAMLDAAFELQKAQLQFLRATGGLEKWALGQK